MAAKESLRASSWPITMQRMLLLSEKSRLGQKVVVRRTRRRRNNLSRGLRWGNRKRSRESSYGRVHYNYFRTYDPSTGRYIESDPIGLLAGLNTYGYVGGNPLNYVDPLGLASKRTCARFFVRRDNTSFTDTNDVYRWTIKLPGVDWTVGPDLDIDHRGRRSPRIVPGISLTAIFVDRIDAVDVQLFQVSEIARIMEHRCKLEITDDCTGEVENVIHSTGGEYRVVDKETRDLIGTTREYRPTRIASYP